MSNHRRTPLVMHVHELGTTVEVWREGLGWWAATTHRRSQRGYFTPEAALRVLTSSWPHEPWLARVGAAARHHALTTDMAEPRARSAESNYTSAAGAPGSSATGARRSASPNRAAASRRAEQSALAGALLELRSHDR
jgi:hypothetical protein